MRTGFFPSWEKKTFGKLIAKDFYKIAREEAAPLLLEFTKFKC